MPRLALITTVPLALVIGGCDGSATGPSPAPVDARGCGDWPAAPGKSFASLDGASQFEVESFALPTPEGLLVSWEAYGCDDITRVGYSRRTDVGFDKPAYLQSPNGQMASNVTFARDTAGTLYAAWASWTPGPSREQPHVGAGDIRIQLARRSRGATDFDAPVELSEPVEAQLYDKPWMIVTAGDAILVSYSDLRRAGIWVASSVDGGATFRRTKVDSVWANLASACPDGSTGGAYLTYVAGSAIRLSHTADAGDTWSAPVDVAVADAVGNPAYQDPTCVAAGTEVWISYGRTHDSYDQPVERLTAVDVVRVAWGQPPTLANATALVPEIGGGFLLFPQLARFADGALAVAAYLAPSEETGTSSLVYTTSSDGGASFAEPIALATGLTARLVRHVPDWLGDYFGWAPLGAGMVAAFVDNTSGHSHIAFHALAR